MAITLPAFSGLGARAGAGGRLRRGVAGVAGRAAAIRAAERRVRDAGRILAALDGLTDGQLEALGLAREDLEDFVAEAVRGRRALPGRSPAAAAPSGEDAVA